MHEIIAELALKLDRILYKPIACIVFKVLSSEWSHRLSGRTEMKLVRRVEDIDISFTYMQLVAVWTITTFLLHNSILTAVSLPYDGGGSVGASCTESFAVHRSKFYNLWLTNANTLDQTCPVCTFFDEIS